MKYSRVSLKTVESDTCLESMKYLPSNICVEGINFNTKNSFLFSRTATAANWKIVQRKMEVNFLPWIVNFSRNWSISGKYGNKRWSISVVCTHKVFQLKFRWFCNWITRRGKRRNTYMLIDMALDLSMWC